MASWAVVCLCQYRTTLHEEALEPFRKKANLNDLQITKKDFLRIATLYRLSNFQIGQDFSYNIRYLFHTL